MKSALVFIVACLMALPAWAASIGDSEYRATMQAMEALQSRMVETINALDRGMTPAEAARLKPEFNERLNWLRQTKAAAAQAGVNTAHTKLKSAHYPPLHCAARGRT